MNALERLRAVLCAPDGDVVIDGTDSDRSIVSEALKELEAALALSRGVPADMVLVPRKLTSDMADAYMRLFTGTERFSAERMWDGLLAAAPAAAGAQGEEPQWVASLRAEVFNSAMKDVFSLSRDEVAHLLGGLLSCAPPAKLAPQPAAADGGVRERARELLAREVDADAAATPGLSIEAERIRNGKTDSAFVDAALRAVIAALSSHRQAGAPVASIGELGGAKVIVLRNYDEIGDLPKGTKLYTAPPPGADLSKFRELAERWRVEARDMIEIYGSDQTFVCVADALEKMADELLALVEKGAGS